ncbi:MAG: polyphosphate kinase 2 [Alphaproteobacteria bacterium]|nr:polyphosphate kinase 2 [Alphaproteobacteria bacterium]MBV9420690.1 polyphosphate kinase 2 [Alphaproteobacteria bacterium]MBV9542724.1 polyphosphate kinase 2 [Alphaproteobacteria bacterium]
MSDKTTLIDKRDYKRQLYKLQVELVKLQRHLIEKNERVLVILEGRDGAGKDGAIKRLTEHMSPRDTRVHAPGKPSNFQETQWYFQRFVPYLPGADEFVIFNRSWYNRAGVERVMGFADKHQVEAFFEQVVPFEAMLVRDGVHLRKYYLDITKKEQKKRLEARGESPLKRWKISPIDAVASKKWDDYSKARDAMLERTSHPAGPWRIVHCDTKKIARLELIRDLLASFHYPHKDKKLVHADSDVVFMWSEDARSEGRIAS